MAQPETFKELAKEVKTGRTWFEHPANLGPPQFSTDLENSKNIKSSPRTVQFGTRFNFAKLER